MLGSTDPRRGIRKSGFDRRFDHRARQTGKWRTGKWRTGKWQTLFSCLPFSCRLAQVAYTMIKISNLEETPAMKTQTICRSALFALFSSLLLTGAALAQTVEERLAKAEAALAGAQTAGDNAWMLTSSALVLLMTGPGLALFYGGL